VYPDIVDTLKPTPPAIAPVESSEGIGLQLDLTA